MEYDVLRYLDTVPMQTIKNCNKVKFDRLLLERFNVDRNIPTGIVLTLSEKVQPEIDDFLEGFDFNKCCSINKPVSDVIFKCFDLTEYGYNFVGMNYATGMNVNGVHLSIKNVRYDNAVYDLKDFQKWFWKLQEAYRDGTGLSHEVSETVNIKLTKRQVERMVFTVAYYFYKDTTEL